MQTATTTATTNPPLFNLGHVVATPGALKALAESEETAIPYLARHVCGDWGMVDPADAQENELSVREGFRIMSVYQTRLGVKIWIITEADRSASTCLLPLEY